MPCWTERQTTLELKATNRPQLLKAITALGWTYHESRYGLEIRTGRHTLTVVGDKITLDAKAEHLVQQLKVQYGMENVKTAAKLNGWNLSRFSFNAEGELVGELSRESV